ncbi:carbonic anhydrase [Naematelia encephala]|uniref:Carbonic anhydrase n=1 Tax=Naematelia encephala TaxID=71784 RepID=A0A1Y2AYX3_9TREE|nr:carbonic anhydrase [Naematelia encephala]
MGSSIAYPDIKELFDRNREWSKQVHASDRDVRCLRIRLIPQSFSHYPGQRPKILWIGCSQPGDIFTHLNIGEAIMLIALQNCPVVHIVITGHTNCVGCQQDLNVASLPPMPPSYALQPGQDMFTADSPPGLDNLLASDAVLNDWKRRGDAGVVVHGWVYHLENASVQRASRI